MDAASDLDILLKFPKEKCAKLLFIQSHQSVNTAVLLVYSQTVPGLITLKDKRSSHKIELFCGYDQFDSDKSIQPQWIPPIHTYNLEAYYFTQNGQIMDAISHSEVKKIHYEMVDFLYPHQEQPQNGDFDFCRLFKAVRLHCLHNLPLAPLLLNFFKTRYGKNEFYINEVQSIPLGRLGLEFQKAFRSPSLTKHYFKYLYDLGFLSYVIGFKRNELDTGVLKSCQPI